MAAVGLDSAYGAYLDRLPAVTLATVNLMSLFGLHRRLRGAIVGHLALFEMTSSIPNAATPTACAGSDRRPAATAFFDEHVEADAVHENIAAVDLAGGLARPRAGAGRATSSGARARWSRSTRAGRDQLLDAWAAGASSLLAAAGRRRRRPESVPRRARRRSAP